MTLMPNGAAISQLMNEPSNQICADCSRPAPNWASLPSGAKICNICAEVHRTIPGTKVKCLTTDVLPAITINYLHQLPNSIVNHIYEGLPIPPNITRPTPNSSKDQITLWIREKYNNKTFVESFSGLKIELHQSLVDAIQHEDVPAFIKLVAQGANPQPITCEGVHVLHLAIEEGLALMVEAILEVGVDVNLLDKTDGRTGIFFAIDIGNFEIVKLLINGHLADLNVSSKDGYDPLSYALAIAQEQPQNQIFMDIYYYILRKVNQGAQRVDSELGSHYKAAKNTAPVKPDEILQESSQAGDQAHSGSSEDESISLSDYL
jgi:hypothetical protein